MIPIRDIKMKRLIEFPFKVEIYKFGIKSGTKPSLKTIAGRGGISLSEHNNSLYFNLGFSNVIKNNGHYFNVTVSKYYLLQMVMDCLLFRPIEPYKPKKYHYSDTKFRGLMGDMKPIEDMHVWGVEAYMRDVLERMESYPVFNLTERQQGLMQTQREALIKRIQTIEFLQPALIGNTLMNMKEGSW